MPYQTFDDIELTWDSKNPDTSFESFFNKILIKLRPTWSLDNLKHKIFTEGLTNQLFGFWQNFEKISDNPKNEAIILRINGMGTEEIINREKELDVWSSLEEIGIACQLFCTFKNGICFAYMPGKCLDVETIAEEKVFKNVAAEMAKAHFTEINLKEKATEETEACWVNYANNFLNKIQRFDHPNTNQFSKTWFQNAIKTLSDKHSSFKSKYNQKLVFCHNDVLCNNILYEFDEDLPHFIDYEYAGFNYAAFDVGNHFNEFTGTDVIDYEKYYPEKSVRRSWAKYYLEKASELSSGADDNCEKLEVLDHEIDEFVHDADVMSLASHLMWGVWAIFQLENSTSDDFDYGNYSKERIDEMLKRGSMIGIEF